MYPVTLELVLRNCREEKLHQFWVVSKTNHQGYISLSFNHWFFSPCRLLLAIINWLKQATWKPFYGESINWNFILVSSVFFINLKSFNHPHHWRWLNYKLRLTVSACTSCPTETLNHGRKVDYFWKWTFSNQRNICRKKLNPYLHPYFKYSTGGAVIISMEWNCSFLRRNIL